MNSDIESTIEAKLVSEQEKLKREREERKAEGLSPEDRRQLADRSQEIKRLMTDEDAKKMEDRRRQSAEEDALGLEKDARLKTVLGEHASFAKNVADQENDQLARIREEMYSRRMRELQQELSAIEAKLEEDSKEKAPDVGLSAEHPGVEKPQEEQVGANEKKEQLKTARWELGNNLLTAVDKIHSEESALSSISPLLDSLREALPTQSRRREIVDELQERANTFVNSVVDKRDRLQDMGNRIRESEEELSQETIAQVKALQEEITEFFVQAEWDYSEFETALNEFQYWARDHQDVLGYDGAEEIAVLQYRCVTQMEAVMGALRGVREYTEGAVQLAQNSFESASVKKE